MVNNKEDTRICKKKLLFKVRYYFLYFIFFFSCSSEKLHPKDFIKWVENPKNGLRIIKTFDEIAYTIQFKPLDYIIAIENSTDFLNRGEAEKRKNELKGLQYFGLRIHQNNSNGDIFMKDINSKEEYFLRDEYASFKMQNDIFLIDGKDTLDCLLFHHVKNYGTAPYADFVMAFAFSENITDKLLVFEDQLFSKGTIKFFINKENINSIPLMVIQ